MRLPFLIPTLVLAGCYHGPQDVPREKVAPEVTRQAAAGPCADTLYVRLGRLNVDSLSPREWELFRVRDAACVQSRH